MTTNGGPKCKVCSVNSVDEKGQTCDDCRERLDKIIDDLKKGDNNGS